MKSEIKQFKALCEKSKKRLFKKLRKIELDLDFFQNKLIKVNVIQKYLKDEAAALLNSSKPLVKNYQGNKNELKLEIDKVFEKHINDILIRTLEFNS